MLHRNTETVPAASWAKIRMVADNPGVWVFHCHIEWHVAAGLSLYFFEATDMVEVNIPSDFENLSPASILSPSAWVVVVVGWYVYANVWRK